MTDWKEWFEVKGPAHIQIGPNFYISIEAMYLAFKARMIAEAESKECGF